MRPRTKLQVQVYDLSLALPKLNPVQKEWGFKNVLRHVGYRTKSKISCLDCGHIWAGPQKVKSCLCPECGEKLQLEDTLKKKLDQRNMVMAIMDVVDDFQLVRYFEINSYHKAGQKADQYIKEIIQQWFKPNEKLTIVGGIQAHGSNGFTGDLEIRTNLATYWNPNKYDVYADKIYPVANVLPIYLRNGFTTKIDDFQPYQLFTELIRDSKTETLLKSKQYSLLRARVGSNRSGSVNQFWDSIKICIRNNYIVKDSITWLDYLDLLQYFNKDLRNPKYVCPSNLKREHDRFVAKKNEAKTKLEIEKKREKVEAGQKAYYESKHAFFGIAFTDGDLMVKVLESVKEFMEEGDIHKHCVFTNEYYKKPDSLILSARLKGKPIETVEISLSKMKILQSRGLQNSVSGYHQQVIDLLNRNMGTIKKQYSALKTA